MMTQRFVVNSHLERWRERPPMQTLIMGLEGLAGKATDSYPALHVKAGIILDMCMWMCAWGGDGGWGCQNTQVGLMVPLIKEPKWHLDIMNISPLCKTLHPLMDAWCWICAGITWGNLSDFENLKGFYTSKSVYSSGGVLRSQWKQLSKVSCGSGGSLLKCEKITQTHSSGLSG